MGYATIDLAIFVPPDLADQAKQWLEKHYHHIKAWPLIRVTDPDDYPARYYGVHLRVTPGMYSAIKRLTQRPQFSTIKYRAALGKRTLRDALKQEMQEKGWRIKP